MTHERTRLTLALLSSLLIHALLFSLTFGGQGLGLTGFAFRLPWQDRRIEAPDLRVVLVPVQATAPEPAVTPIAEALEQGREEQPAAGGFALTPPMSPAPTPRRTTAAIVAGTYSSEEVNPGPGAARGAAPAKTPVRAVRPGGTAPPPVPESAVIASARSDEPTWVVPVTPAVPTPAIPTAPSASTSETAMPPLRDTANETRAQIDEEARERAVEQVGLDRARQDARRQAEQMEAARQEAERVAAAQQDVARQEAERKAAAEQDVARQESEQKAAVRQEAARQEAARQETARQETARQETARQETARQETARQETARQEAARQAVARQEAARQEAARQEATRQAAAREEATRQEATRQESARQEAERQAAAQQAAARQEAEEKREARLRAIGRQLDEEAARRDAASAASRPLASSSGLRRYRLFGRADANAELILYVEAWERKIQLNMTFDMVREAAKLPHTNPMVTVAIRSDGSVESVTFVLSSGVVAIDEAIRRIVRSQEHYQAFPPDLVSEFDVIEIRRTWSFDMAIRLY